MPNQYNPKHFLLQVPNGMLKQFFDQRNELADLRWEDLSETDVDPIFEAWMQIPGARRTEIERWFRAVAELARPDGLQTVIDESQFHKTDLTQCFAQMKGLHEKVFWVYLNHSRIFLSASRLNRADHLNGRYWRRRTDLPAKAPDTSHPTRELLGQEISKYYRERQGRGEHCGVEVYLRREKIHYFFAYPADYADTVIVYDDAGTLERQHQKAAFEVIFAYNESSGALDVFVQGGKELRRDMEEIFARLVLNEELPTNNPTRQTYELNGLRSREFDFPTDPEDRITEVRVKALRLSIPGPGFGQITVESDAYRQRGDIYDLMEKALNKERLEANSAGITRATLEVVFEADDKPKRVKFYVAQPDVCNLKDDPEHLKIREYLRRWGIENED